MKSKFEFNPPKIGEATWFGGTPVEPGWYPIWFNRNRMNDLPSQRSALDLAWWDGKTWRHLVGAHFNQGQVNEVIRRDRDMAGYSSGLTYSIEWSEQWWLKESCSNQAAYLKTVTRLREVAKNSKHVTEDWILAVASMHPEEMRDRLIRMNDTLMARSTCLDGIREIQFIPGGSFDGARDGRAVRNIVVGLLAKIKQLEKKT